MTSNDSLKRRERLDRCALDSAQYPNMRLEFLNSTWKPEGIGKQVTRKEKGKDVDKFQEKQVFGKQSKR